MNENDPYERLLKDMNEIRSPWYWQKRYVAVGVFFLIIATAAYLILF